MQSIQEVAERGDKNKNYPSVIPDTINKRRKKQITKMYLAIRQ